MPLRYPIPTKMAPPPRIRPDITPKTKVNNVTQGLFSKQPTNKLQLLLRYFPPNLPVPLAPVSQQYHPQAGVLTAVFSPLVAGGGGGGKPPAGGMLAVLAVALLGTVCAEGPGLVEGVGN